MADFKQIDEARKLLELGEKATLEDIKRAYRKMSFRYHPDRFQDKREKAESEEMFKRVNAAKDVLMTYCLGCYFSFKKEDVEKTVVDKTYYDHMRRFYDGWWSDLNL